MSAENIICKDPESTGNACETAAFNMGMEAFKAGREESTCPFCQTTESSLFKKFHEGYEQSIDQTINMALDEITYMMDDAFARRPDVMAGNIWAVK